MDSFISLIINNMDSFSSCEQESVMTYPCEWKKQKKDLDMHKEVIFLV